MFYFGMKEVICLAAALPCFAGSLVLLKDEDKEEGLGFSRQTGKVPFCKGFQPVISGSLAEVNLNLAILFNPGWIWSASVDSGSLAE